MVAPYWFQAFSLVLNVIQTIALAYVTSRWRRVNGNLEAVRAEHNRGDTTIHPGT